jgi:hypothetical protein
MASLSNINGLFDVHSTGAILFSTSHGTSGQILRSNGNAAPTWVDSSTVIGGPYLPLAGGTLTGATATATGISFTVGGNLFVSGTSTLSGAVTITQNSGSLQFANTGSGHASITTGLSKDLNISSGSGTVYINSSTTFSGTVTAPTFSGDLNGTINTLTTATTQAASNNSTKVATTAYADAAATAVPIGDYLPLAGGTMTGVTQFNDHTNYGDQVAAKFGASQDLQIYHDGSNSHIKDTGTGALFVETDYFRLVNPSAAQSMISANTGGSVILYNAGGEKLATTSTGVSVTGGGDFTGNLKLIAGASTTYFSEKGYLGDSFNFGTGETTDGVSYTINGAQAGTAGNYFRWLTQTGAATPTEKVRITDEGSLVVGNTPGTNVNWGRIQCGGTITVGNSSGTYNAHGRISGDSTSGLRLIGTKSGTYTTTAGITIASSNVGINTIAPAANLHVEGSTSSASFRLSPSGTTYENYRLDAFVGAAEIALQLKLNDHTFLKTGGYLNLSDLILGTKDYSDTLRLNSGNVLINATTTPFLYGGSTLHVGGARATLGLKSTGSLATIALSSNNVSDKDIHINHNGTDGSISFYQYSVSPVSARVSFFLSGGGYLGLGTVTPNARLQVAGKAIINSTGNYTSNAGSLSVNNASQANGGIVDTHINGGARYYTRVAHGYTGSSSGGYWHIKTNINVNASIMFLAKFYGYVYGQSAVVDLQHTGYAYTGGSVIAQGTTNNSSVGGMSSAVYLTAANEMCFRIDLGGSTYYAGLWMDIGFQNPTGGNLNFNVEGTAWSATANYYT